MDTDLAPGRKPFISGHRMICPNCERYSDVLAFRPLQSVTKYDDETNPIVKCPRCRWVFSPGISRTTLNQLMDELRKRVQPAEHPIELQGAA